MDIRKQKEVELEPNYNNIEYFEDILRIVGSAGKRNILVFVLCSLGALTNPLLLFTYIFLGATPEHWCHSDALSNTTWTTEQIKNISIPRRMLYGELQFTKCQMYDLGYESLSLLSYEEAQIEVDSHRNIPTLFCSQRDFDGTVETVVTKWDLVCDRRALYATTQSAIHLGVLIGCLMFGYLLDRYGRIRIYRASVIVHILIGLVIALSPYIGIFILLKVLSAVSAFGFYMSGFVMAVELTTCKQRSLVAVYYVLPWAFGIMLASAISYVIRPWYYLQVALTLPNLILLLGVWLLPESPRWLLLNGRHKEAYKIMKVFANTNGVHFPYTASLEMAMEKLCETSYSGSPDENISLKERFMTFLRTNAALLSQSNLRLRTLGIYFCWFSSAMIYYSISLGSTALSSSDYLFIFLGGVIELVSYLLLWPATVYLGRRRSLVFSFFFAAFTIIAAMVVVILVVRNELVELKMALFLAGKFAITANFHLLWVYTAELYPTSHRSLAVGQASMMARVGSVCSPYLNDILGEVASWAPSALFGVTSLIAGSIALIFPETRNSKLPDVLQPLKDKQSPTAVSDDMAEL